MVNPILHHLHHHHHRLLLDTPEPSTMSNGNSTHEAYVNETNFDTNMVIILAALLCALIGALGLNSIVRCAMRCSRRLSPESQGQAATGLKKRALRQIPVAVYGPGVEIPATECPICLGEFVQGEKVRVLPKCNHGFHVRCIDTWLVSHSSCPNCRHSLLERPTTSDAAGEVAPEQPQPNGSTHQGSIVIAVHETS
ncbi:hypothetical protein AAG906_037158 [Vitis piasezkii]|uniref:RING-type E3 ubiquitin transferase n=2 Tax=Vitis vinifera TaxID=29760 RepID=A0A438DZZ9_VITVI|nr:RING-H2 finger protein ATL74 [Vitis vinifera]RVW40990.1 RING-H2 finger protein ATL72 [Vitis vinifera]RVX00607.1 RING-H2 finger protein ATL72 [Vitis vinifera]WJZ92951.1 hypothetical protein VitviT2T_011921 [Vitis vinifera]|eukprot:XP_002271473.1 PREDICTED: RING-H2 finger protein ATL74 [Vitis vinifera]